MTPGRISASTRARLRVEARDRCGYCRTRQFLAYGPLEVDHITFPRLREAATKLTIYGSPVAHATNIKGVKSTDVILKVDKEFDYLIRVGRDGIATSGGAKMALVSRG